MENDSTGSSGPKQTPPDSIEVSASNLKIGVDPVPKSGISEVLGLLEVLDDRKGKVKVYTLARDLNFNFSDLLLIIKAAEMLDFVYTPGTDVVLKALGKKMIEIDMNAKKKIVLNQLRKISLFQYLREHLMTRDDKRMSQQDFLDLCQLALPKEMPDQVFETVINWGRYSEFLGFSTDDGYVYLDQG
jgi:NitT/TauT family transport system ATP-binding protein